MAPSRPSCAGPDASPPGDLAAAFADRGADGCRLCTPRVLAAAAALFGREPVPSRAEIEQVLAVSGCFCTGYKPVLEAMLATAARRAGES